MPPEDNSNVSAGNAGLVEQLHQRLALCEMGLCRIKEDLEDYTLDILQAQENSLLKMVQALVLVVRNQINQNATALQTVVQTLQNYTVSHLGFIEQSLNQVRDTVNATNTVNERIQTSTVQHNQSTTSNTNATQRLPGTGNAGNIPATVQRSPDIVDTRLPGTTAIPTVRSNQQPISGGHNAPATPQQPNVPANTGGTNQSTGTGNVQQIPSGIPIAALPNRLQDIRQNPNQSGNVTSSGVLQQPVTFIPQQPFERERNNQHANPTGVPGTQPTNGNSIPVRNNDGNCPIHITTNCNCANGQTLQTILQQSSTTEKQSIIATTTADVIRQSTTNVNEKVSASAETINNLIRELLRTETNTSTRQYLERLIDCSKQLQVTLSVPTSKPCTVTVNVVVPGMDMGTYRPKELIPSAAIPPEDLTPVSLPDPKGYDI